MGAKNIVELWCVSSTRARTNKTKLSIKRKSFLPLDTHKL